MKKKLRKLLRVFAIFGLASLLMSNYGPTDCFGGGGNYTPPYSHPPGYGNPLSPHVGHTRMHHGHLEQWNGHRWVHVD